MTKHLGGEKSKKISHGGVSFDEIETKSKPKCLLDAIKDDNICLARQMLLERNHGDLEYQDKKRDGEY